MNDNSKQNLNHIDRFVVTIGDKISYAYIALVVIALFEIFMRYILNQPTKWVHETTIAIASFCMLYGGLYAFAKNKHIRVSFIADSFPPKLRSILNFLSYMISLSFILILFFASYKTLQGAIFAPNGTLKLERSGSIWNPAFPGILKISLFLFSLIFCIQIIFRLWESFKEIIRHFKRR